MAIHIDPKAIVQRVNVTEKDLALKTPMAMSVSGSSMSGKSEFLLKLVLFRGQMFDVEFQRIIYCQPESLVLRHNPIFEKIKAAVPNAELVVGLPNVELLHLNLDTTPKLVLIDDQMMSFLNSEAMMRLLSVDTHHFNITTIFTLQNYFAASKFGKSLPRNCTYRCIFFNRLDLTEIRMISTQICHHPRFLLESFEFLTKEFPNQVPYLLIDGHIHSPLKDLFVRSHIFPQEDSNEIKPIFFFPKQ